jgi:beta-lactamase class A
MTTTSTALEGALRTIIEQGPATGGVAVRHIERDERISFDGSTAYPAASVFKVPVLVEAFRQIGQGAFTLDDRWTLTEEEKSTGSGVLVRLQAGLPPCVRDLLTLMIIISDNTATDMLVRRLGPERITATMRALGLHNTVVANTCRDLLRGILGDAPPALAPHEMAAYIKEHPINPESAAYKGGHDNNVTTAEEMVELFRRIHTGDGLDAIGVDAGARATMREILLLQQLNDRMPRFLPPGTRVAHKTGSLSGPWAVRNDAGLLELGERGTVALAFFTCTRTPADQDPAASSRFLTSIDEEIAALTRAVYDHYTAE